MRRNVAGQFIGAQMITAADGTAFAGSVTVSVTGDAGTQATGSVGSGVCAHEGNGFHTYAPAQAETNYTHVAFTFTGTGAIPATVQIYPTSYDASGRSDVGMFGGSAGTFSSGRPEVNATHLAGTAYATQRDALVDLIWDEVLNAAAHNVAGSAGRRLRQLGASSITGGTAQAGASNSITLAAGESATNEIFDSNLIIIIGGTGAGQTRVIVEYNGTTKVATIDQVWVVTPDVTSEYEIFGAHQSDIAHHGLAQAGAATSITLSSTASATDDVYVGSTIYLSTSTGSGQARLITDYDGATKVATVSPAWAVNPGANSVYKILPIGRAIVDSGTVTTVSGNVNGSVGSVTGAVGSVTGAVGSVTGAVTVGTNNDKTGYSLSATGSAAMTEGYAALGAAATLPQLLYEVRALLAEKSISTTTLTTKKLDGSTTAATYTLDDATTPSAITRAT